MPNQSSILTRSAPFRSSAEVEGSDEELIRAARTDPQAFEALYRRYVGRIYAYLFSFTYNAAEAEDLTSQTFLAAWKGLGRYREQGAFAAWLFRIARNQARDLHRRNRPHLPIDCAGNLQVEWDPAAGVEKQETLQKVDRLVERLEADQIELLRLRYSAGLSYAEIGAVLGRSPEATKMAFHRLFQKLRSEWKVCDE
jgi:RNA polymerase sigma-70 factor (ECF subfamily)